MKKALILIITIFALISCRNSLINGKLDGMWQLMKIEKENGEDLNTKEDRIYYNVQLHLISLTKIGVAEYIGRFNHVQDSLFIYDFRVDKNNATLATKEELAPFGLNEVSERFEVEKMDSKDMVLKSKTARLVFRKF